MDNARTVYSKVVPPRGIQLVPLQRWELFPFLIGLTILITTVSIFHVWSRVRVIDLNLQLTDSRRELKELQQEQNRLKLEAASHKNPARIEALAKGALGLALPTDQQVVVVK